MNDMKQLLIYIIGVILCCFGNTLSAQAIVSSDSTVVYTKAMGDSAYAAADYATAIRVYEQLLSAYGESAAIYYNLGGAYYKVGAMARAILNYERALLFDPSNADIRFNLELARSKTIDKSTLPSELFFVGWWRDFTSLLSADGWAHTAILCFLVLILCLVLFIFSKKGKTKKIIFIFALFSLLCTVLANLSASYRTAKLKHRESAIIMDPSVVVRSTPSTAGTELFILHEGKKVTIKDDSMNAWLEILVEDGNIGWLPAESVERI